MAKKKTAWQKRIDKLQQRQKDLLAKQNEWQQKIDSMKKTKEEMK